MTASSVSADPQPEEVVDENFPVSGVHVYSEH